MRLTLHDRAINSVINITNLKIENRNLAILYIYSRQILVLACATLFSRPDEGISTSDVVLRLYTLIIRPIKTCIDLIIRL